MPDPVHHHNLGKVAVPTLITPRLFVPRVILPRHRIHTIANLLCNYKHGYKFQELVQKWSKNNNTFLMLTIGTTSAKKQTAKKK